jgi:hypothetical protein
VVVVCFILHLQSQSATPLAVAKENAELWPSRRLKNPLSWPNLNGLADLAVECELLIAFMKVVLSTSIETTFEPTVASSYIYRITAFTPGLSGKFFMDHYKIKLRNLRFQELN